MVNTETVNDKAEPLVIEGFQTAPPNITRTTLRLRRGEKHQRTIRFRLACLMLVPVCIITALLLYYSYHQKRTAIESRVLETTRTLSQVIDGERARMQASATALATSPTLVSGDMAEFYRQSQLVLRDYPNSDIILADSTGQQLVNTYVPLGAPLPRRNVPDAVRAIYTSGKPYISNLFQGAVTKRSMITIDVPVYRNGRVVYDLGLTTSTERWSELIAKQRFSPEWTVSVFDTNSVIVARNRFPEKYVGMSASPVLAARTKQSTEGVIEASSKEGTQLVAMFSRSEVTGWTTAIGIPKSVFVAEIWRSLQFVVCGVIAFSVIGFGLAMLLSRRLAGSIQALIPPATALGRGELLEMSSFDLVETANVGQSLLHASKLLQERTEQLTEYRQHLEELVEKRTYELELLNTQLLKDVAERKRAEEELRQSTEFLRALTDNTEDAIYVKDRNGRWLFANPALLQIVGKTLDEVVGKTDLEIYEYSGIGAAITANDNRIMERNEAEAVEEKAITPAGVRFFLSTKAPRRDAEGRVIGLVGISRDITDRKYHEETLLRSEKLAAVGRMAATIAHEINNPLSAATNSIFLAKTAQDADTARAYLDTADSELRRMAHITRQSLGFYRESNESKLTSIGDVLESAIDLLASRVRNKQATIVKEWACDLQVNTVAGELRQVFANLIVNSLDAIEPKGTVKLRISAQNDYVRVTISDNGKGIPPDDRNHIFEPFFTTKGSVGTGLGLWVSKQIIEKHNGKIRMHSSIYGAHRGTTVCVILPRKAAAGNLTD